MRLTEDIYLVGSAEFGLSNAYDCHVYLLDGGEEATLIDCGVGYDTGQIIRNIEKYIDIEKVKGQLQETAFYKKAQSILNHQNDTDAKSTEKPVLTNDDQKSLIKEINCLIPEYTSHLRKNFPLLTDKDIFFCCIHLSGFSIQELGVILSRTPNSIYKRRGSILEKKMQLDKNDNFIKAITAI